MFNELDKLIQMLQPPKSIKRSGWNGYQVSTIYEYSQELYEVAILRDTTKSVFLIYLGRSKLVALWHHYWTFRALRKGTKEFYVIGSSDAYDAEGIGLHAPKLVNVYKKGKSKKSEDKIVSLFDKK